MSLKDDVHKSCDCCNRAYNICNSWTMLGVPLFCLFSLVAAMAFIHIRFQVAPSDVLEHLKKVEVKVDKLIQHGEQ